MKPAPTPEQTAAIQTRAPEVLLEAGAGTGKTGVLVDRYCDLIGAEDVGPEEILAFTFTERAGAQLRERIRAELPRRAREAGDGEAAARLGSSTSWAAPGSRRSTASAVVCSHPIRWRRGSTPPSGCSTGPESQRRHRAAFDSALEQFLAGADEARETTVAAYGIDGLRAAVLGAHEELRSSGEAQPELPDPPESDLLGALERLGHEAAAVNEVGSAAQREKIADAAASSRRRAVSGSPPWRSFMRPASAPARASSRASSTRSAKRRGSSPSTPGGGSAYSHLARAPAALRRALREAKGERSGLDFEDLQLEAVRLLRESTAVRESYAGRFRHILVDEFQDTNALQLELVELLRCPGASVFFVGDEFQSIYGFRHADVEVFRREREAASLAGAGAVLPLSGNFRSRPEVIATANRIGELMLPGSGR